MTTEESARLEREHRKERRGITTKVTIGGMRGYITANPDEEGKLFEIFVHGFGKYGSAVQGWVDCFCITMSLGIQSGLSLDVAAPRLCKLKFEPYGETDNAAIPHCNSVPDYLCRWLAQHFGSDDLKAELDEVYKSMLPDKTGR